MRLEFMTLGTLIPCSVFVIVFLTILTTQSANPILVDDYMWQAKIPYLIINGFGILAFGISSIVIFIVTRKQELEIPNTKRSTQK